MEASPLLARHRARGVRLAARPEAPEHAAPLVFEAVPEEYRAGREGCALFDATDRGRVTVRGADALEFLHRLLANSVRTLGAGGANANLLLSPKGKVRFAFDLARHPEHLELSTPPGLAPALAQALESYHFTERLELEDSSARHAPLELEGPQVGATLGRLLGREPGVEPGSWRAFAWQGAELVVLRTEPGSTRHVVSAPDPIALWDALVAAGARPAGLAARDCLRVEDGRALFGIDVDENVYPQEAGLEHAFALDKGCFVGQEVVAKIDTYGGLNKRLLRLSVEHSEPVPRGTQLLGTEGDEGRELGLVTSWAYSFRWDTGLVLAYVKRKHQDEGTEFELEGGRGRVKIVAP